MRQEGRLTGVSEIILIEISRQQFEDRRIQESRSTTIVSFLHNSVSQRFERAEEITNGVRLSFEQTGRITKFPQSVHENEWRRSTRLSRVVVEKICDSSTADNGFVKIDLNLSRNDEDDIFHYGRAHQLLPRWV